MTREGQVPYGNGVLSLVVWAGSKGHPWVKSLAVCAGPRVEKFYHAIVEDSPSLRERGVIKGQLRAVSAGSGRAVGGGGQDPGRDGQAARTLYRVLQRRPGQAALLELQPVTGEDRSACACAQVAGVRWSCCGQHSAYTGHDVPSPLTALHTSYAWRQQRSLLSGGTSCSAVAQHETFMVDAQNSTWECTRAGRKHQLRAHCADLGAPILGDGLHGRTRSPLQLRFGSGFNARAGCSHGHRRLHLLDHSFGETNCSPLHGGAGQRNQLPS